MSELMALAGPWAAQAEGVIGTAAGIFADLLRLSAYLGAHI